MTFRLSVEKCQGDLTGAEQRLVRELLSSPVEGAFFSSAQLAARTGVHQATAVRLAKKLGYRGYPELRSALRSEVVKSEPAERVRRRLRHIEDQSVLDGLIAGEIASLQQLGQHISQPQLDAAARLMIRARRLFLFAQGHATSLLELMDRRLRRAGFETCALHHQGRELAERILTLGRRDAVLAFAFHARPPGLVPLLGRAGAAGAPCILVSDLLAPLIRPRANIVLAAPRGLDEEFQTLTVPMLICNALVLTVSRLDGGKSIQALGSLTHAIELFEGENITQKGAQ